MKKWLLIPLILFVIIYFYSMVLQPLIIGDFKGKFLMDTWHEWQSWNAAVLAFISAVLFLRIQMFLEDKKRQNQAKAVRAFLPQQLSQLSNLCKFNLGEINRLLVEIDKESKKAELLREVPIIIVKPFGEEHFSSFKESIEFEDGDLVPELSELLGWMQIIESRLDSLKKMVKPERPSKLIIWEIQSNFMDIACLKVRLERIFKYARGLSCDFKQTGITIEDVKNTTFNMVDKPVQEGTELHEYALSYLENKRYVLKDKTPEKTK